jgi:polyphosphate kinase 2 (PPK2 family)
MTAMNPQGVHVRPFMAPSATELRHHFLWRFKKELPQPGHITIFNRSYYEDVLLARVKKLVALDVIESGRHAVLESADTPIAQSLPDFGAMFERTATDLKAPAEAAPSA